MKKASLFFVVFYLLLNTTFSQSINDLFDKTSKTPITWLGIDYSHVKLIGDFSQYGGAGEMDGYEIQNKYFPAWNHFVLNEPEKYNVKRMLRRNDIEINLEMTDEINTTNNEFEAKQLPEYTNADIEKFVSQYKTGLDGLGVLFLAEYMDKNKQLASYHFIVINNKSNEILLHETYTKKGGGFGLRNYWARSFYNVMIEIEKSNKKLKKKYFKQ